MSLDYAYIKIINIVLEIEQFQEQMEYDEYAETSNEIVSEIQSLLSNLKIVQERLHHLEWWMNGDYGDNTYIEKIKGLKNERGI